MIGWTVVPDVRPGGQRSSVTLAFQGREGARLIWTRRGRIEIRDRERLIAAAGGGQGPPKRNMTA